MKVVIIPILLVFMSYLAKAQCSISIDAGASGCYWDGTTSKTKIVVEVSWANAPAGQNIVVTGPPGSSPATRTITPGNISVTYLNRAVPPVTYATANQTIVSPQQVTFEMDANGATGLTVSANFSTTTSCSAVSNPFTLPTACTPIDCSGGLTGGTVFFDFNADGIRTSDETETGVVGVTIKAIDKNGTVYTTTSQKYGRWVLNIPSNAYPIRVEFSNLPNYARQGTLNGTDGRTTTQFISAPDCNIDLGVLENSEYASTNPAIFLTQMPSGNPLDATGNVKDMDALLKVDYTAQGARDPSKTLSIAKADEIGCTWGLAHNKYTNKLFVSAFVRRHSGLGPKGIGGIYVVDPTSGLVDSWDVESDFGIDVGSISDNFTRGLNKNVSGSSIDPEGLAKTCKEGIGDMDISENGNSLFFVNMFDKKLYRIDLTAYNTSGTKPTSANISSWSITNPGCVGGNYRPMGLKWYKGFLYVGVVCDGQTSNSKSNLRAFLYKLNPGNGVWSSVFDFPLTYPKGFPNKDNRDITGWYPWTDDWSDFIELVPLAIAYPQPVFSDIEFDVDGSVVLAFGDRNGFQTGYRNRASPDDGKSYSGFVGGDILRAFNNGSGKFVVENNAMAGPNVGYAPGNNQGPGFGEYYNDDWIGDKGNLNHAECVLGALALKPGEGKVIVSIIDPVDSINWAGGFRFYDNATGLRTQAFTVYETDVNDIGTFAKSGGLGDMELLIELPTFIEVGNRAWIDTDKNGVQDPDESPLPGVKVAIYKSGVKIAETLTNSSGEYYFSTKSANDVNLNWLGTGADTALLASTSYQLVFGETQFVAGQLTISGTKYELTVANSTTGTGNDQNDSDATIISNLPRINLNSPVEGAVNHTYDVGFSVVPVCEICPPTLTIAGLGFGSGSAPLAENVTIDGSFPLSESNIAGFLSTGSSEGVFYTFCTEITQPLLPLQNPYTHTANGSANGFTSLQALRVAQVFQAAGFTSALGLGAGNNTTANMVALQMAVWNAFYDTDYSISTGNFQMLTDNNVGVRAIANAWLLAAQSIAAPNTSVHRLTHPTGQDLVFQNCITMEPGICNSGTSTYDLSGFVFFSNAPTAGSLTVSVSGGGSQVFTAPFSSPQAYTITGLTADGSSHTVTAVFSADLTCQSTATYTAPANCTPLVCSSTVTAAAGPCNAANNQYTVTGQVTLTNPPSTGTVTVQIVGGGNQTFTLPQTSPISYSIAGQIADGVSHTVEVTVSGVSCGSSIMYTAPTSCTVNCPSPNCVTLKSRKVINN